MQRLVVLFFFLFFAISAHAQKGSISGFIKNKETGEALTGATIMVSGTSQATSADSRGFFRLKLVPATYELKISFVGYQTGIVQTSVTENILVEINVLLSPGDLMLQNIEISGMKDPLNTISQIDINLRPGNTSQDVLRMVPGLFIAQHAGGGKAEQIFLRGFDIDHGTDINLEVDGLPVNMVSHAHGQGYSDLHFLIPEIIGAVEFNKGPYYAETGDFTTAGYVSFVTRNKLENNLVKIEGGLYATGRNVIGLNLLDRKSTHGDHNAFVATELFRSDGYFERPQDFTRFNGTGKYVFNGNNGKRLVVGGSSFTSQWNASGQVPERAIQSGMISRFGSIDDSEGGETSRTQGYFDFITPVWGNSLLETKLYVVRYDFLLFSNFTFFLNNTTDGDQIRQRESRMLYGYTSHFTRQSTVAGKDLVTEIGAGVRFDVVDDVRLSNTKKRNTFIEDLARGDVRELNANVFLNQTWSLTGNFSIRAGARLDHFRFRYNNRLTEQNKEIGKTIISPKISLDYIANANTTFFVKSGFGFHSNDARVVVAQRGMDILPRAFGIDVGTITKITPQLIANLTGWILDLEQEFVYVGDKGIVEPGGRTRRMGTDLSLRYQLKEWLFADADLNITYGRSRDDPEGENFLPLASVVSGLGGITIFLNNGLNASLRYRYLGDRPANEDNSVVAHGYGLLDAAITWRLKKIDLNLSAENLLNSEWKEAQFDTVSRLQEEAESTSEIHFTPGSPFFIKAGVSFKF